MRFLFFQAEDGIRDLVRSRGLGDVYKRQEDGRSGDAVGAVRSFAFGADRIREHLLGLSDRVLSLIHI